MDKNVQKYSFRFFSYPNNFKSEMFGNVWKNYGMFFPFIPIQAQTRIRTFYASHLCILNNKQLKKNRYANDKKQQTKKSKFKISC